MIKNVIIASLIVVCLVLIGIHFNKKEDPAKPIIKEAKDLVDAEVDRITRNIDNKGFEHAVIDEVENVVNGRRQLSDSTIIMLDSTTKLLKIKDKQIEHLIIVNATLKADNLKATKNDKGFSYRDKWTNIDFINPTDSSSSGYFNFSYNADFNHAEYWKRDWFLGKKKHYIDFWISDQRATINGVKRIKFETQEPKLSLRVQGSGILNPIVGSYGFGPGIRIDAGRFSFQGNYIYYPQSGIWGPLINGNYDIIRF